MSQEKRRLIATLESYGNAAKVYHSAVWSEYQVELFYQGVHQTKATIHTDDKQDAHDSAKHALVLMSKATQEPAK